jgi:hypothetical protein
MVFIFFASIIASISLSFFLSIDYFLLLISSQLRILNMEAFFENVGILLALKIDILAGLATRINNRMTLDVAE